MADTLHWSDTGAEIHKVVVGPTDNNVFVLRCNETGEAVLIDAANEHERLLELCDASASAGARDPRPLGPHPGRAGGRDAGYRVGVTAEDAEMLDKLRRHARGRVGHRGRRPALDTIHTPGHTQARCARLEGPPVLFSGDTPFPAASWATPSRRPLRPTIIRSIEDACLARPRPSDHRMPGHGDDTTIGTERPHLQEWIDRGW